MHTARRAVLTTRSRVLASLCAPSSKASALPRRVAGCPLRLLRRAPPPRRLLRPRSPAARARVETAYYQVTRTERPVSLLGRTTRTSLERGDEQQRLPRPPGLIRSRRPRAVVVQSGAHSSRASERTDAQPRSFYTRCAPLSCAASPRSRCQGGHPHGGLSAGLCERVSSLAREGDETAKQATDLGCMLQPTYTPAHIRIGCSHVERSRERCRTAATEHTTAGRIDALASLRRR